MHKYCLNCGKKGHINKNCRFPTNSYGCIIYRQPEPPDQSIRYLLIQRKYTPEYIELLRGKYYLTAGDSKELDYRYLILLVKDLPLIERQYITQHSFADLWKKLWNWSGTAEQTQTVYGDYQECRRKFELLQKGQQFGKYGFLSFASLFADHPTQIVSTNWEFPKGKRQEGENNQACAIRECCEETALAPEDFEILSHVVPFQERFTGVNNIKYCNNYYVGRLTNHHKCLYYHPLSAEQNREIRNIGWFTLEQIQQITDPQLPYHLQMISNVHLLVQSLASTSISTSTPTLAPTPPS